LRWGLVGSPDDRDKGTSDSSTDAVRHGVGPWEGEWPADPRLDPALLLEGDRRNVEDRYRYWSHEAITADLATRRHTFHVAIANWEHDFNIGSVVRTANAMGAAAFHIVGRRRWNRRGAMVTDRYQVEHHHRDVAGLVDRSEEHTSELQSRFDLVCRLLLEKKKQKHHRS